MAFTIEDLMLRLGISTCPRRYLDFVAEVGSVNLEGTLASPAAICALPYTQSMLDPIMLSQVRAAAAELIGAEFFGGSVPEFREGTNPFTGEPQRMPFWRRGVRIQLAQGERMFLSLRDGHLYRVDAPRETPPEVDSLAAKLAARVSRY